ncbi:glycoside hydrolase 5 family protein [Spirosoma fluviale]|uniref:Cellulase (Glycosyl hydrolase family 5) n=1 Tax=Spirosoma fluviale TaxID=1597977 RepID=A0A286GRY0_9BACT|nr:cellulase family glycosylhydrolase [Spirosoma fluviale]SOD97694.1 Cellulase (glycosyl hydrolase family 5) [Spirosoma fluviale]
MKRLSFLVLLFISTLSLAQQSGNAARWSATKANAWYVKEPFLVGANYAPANAINELEMFQAETFDPATIDKELAMAESIGMNTMRVFLHDLLWQDPAGFTKRLDQFLAICAKHKIRPMLVLFDSCWDPNPKLGKQHEPTPGIHNSGWVQSPGADALTDVSQYPRLEAYVKGVVGAFKKDKRILSWDVWNEPDNTNDNSYGQNHTIKTEVPKTRKIAIVTSLLPHVFEWARAAGATQPLTSGIWVYRTPEDWQNPAKWTPMEKVQMENSDIITFHQYSNPETLEKTIPAMLSFGRPVICTEYMARGVNSKFQSHLPIAKKAKVGMINWGFVAGKTQTFMPWDSWQKPYVNGREPAIWFHEVFKQDGTPYDPDEITAIRQATGK